MEPDLNNNSQPNKNCIIDILCLLIKLSWRKYREAHPTVYNVISFTGLVPQCNLQNKVKNIPKQMDFSFEL